MLFPFRSFALHRSIGSALRLYGMASQQLTGKTSLGIPPGMKENIMPQNHHFPTLEELTRAAMAACHDCNCSVCQVHGEALRRVLVYPSRRHKHVAAIAAKPALSFDPVTKPKSPKFHERVTNLVVTTAKVWTCVFDRFDDQARALAVEHFSDAWRQLETCQTDDAWDWAFKSSKAWGTYRRRRCWPLDVL